MIAPWMYLTCCMLGLWLMFSPSSMGYPSQALAISDYICGIGIFAISFLYFFFKKDWFKWLMATIGAWLTFAPLVFWSPDAASYANDTLMGSLIIICSVIIPSIVEEKGPHDTGVPRNWSYNPSSWSQRFPIIMLAFIGFLMARYLSAFQLGHMKDVWDPFFGDGTKNVLTSDVSKMFPVSDAGLGAWSYLLDALSGAIGGTRRWRNMPWVVILFGIMIVPPGVTSITLIILQPLAVGDWCTICLITAIIMLLMVPPAVDEVVATIQGLMEGRKRGHPFWKMFWSGIPSEPSTVIATPDSLIPTAPANQVICTLLGSWVMFAPTVFNAQDLASDTLHFLGALIVTFAIVSMAQVARPVRFINTILGAVLAFAVWFTDGGSLMYQLNATVVGLLLMYFSVGLGKIEDRFGSYDKVVNWVPFRRTTPPHHPLRRLLTRN